MLAGLKYSVSCSLGGGSCIHSPKVNLFPEILPSLRRLATDARVASEVSGCEDVHLIFLFGWQGEELVRCSERLVPNGAPLGDDLQLRGRVVKCQRQSRRISRLLFNSQR